MPYKVTPSISRANDYIETLRSFTDQIIGSNSWWQRPVSISDKLCLIKELAAARALLFATVEQTYPELAGTSYSVSGLTITPSIDKGVLPAAPQKKDEEDLTRVDTMGAGVRQPYRINQSGE